MRRIEKGPEPDALRARRETPGATSWGAVSERAELREALFEEQHGLCAYCLSRLPGTGPDHMRIEHWEPRSTTAGRKMQLLWSNLLGVCLGEVGPEGRPEERFHCDRYRGNLPLRVHPARHPPDAATLFRYTPVGEVLPEPSAGAPGVDAVRDTIDHLNLNIERLRRNRAAIIERLRQRLRDGMRPTELEALIARNSRPSEGTLPEYCEIARKYLAKKKRQRGW